MLATNRYPGPKPFTFDEQAIFFGRDEDIATFYKYIFLHQMVVLFGESGYGKSSLINAGILPKIAQNNPSVIFFEVKLTPFLKGENIHSPIDQVKTIVQKRIVKNTAFLIETYFDTKKDNSLWRYVKNVQLSYDINQYIFFFDQFENLFTYPQESITAFKHELADILYSTLPAHYRLQEDSLEQADVSEEFKLTLYQKPDVRVVFSIRSDRLGLLDDMKDYHPAILRNCYELKALDIAGALQAVQNPARLSNRPKGTYKTAPFAIEEKLCTAIVLLLKDGNDRIQTSTLQIICWQIEDNYEKLINQDSEQIDFNPVTSYTLTSEEFGHKGKKDIKKEIENIFNDYYRNTIKNKIPENLQEAAAQLIEKVLVQDKRRIPFEGKYLIREFLLQRYKVHSEEAAKDILDKLTEASLLKVEQDSQRRMMYELGHDTLIEPITEAAKIREEKETKEKLKQAEIEAKELRQLKQKAETRSWVAIGISVLAIISAIYAYQQKINADNATAQADLSKTIAITAQDSAIIAKKRAENNLQKFYVLQMKEYIKQGDELTGLKAYKAAIDCYNAALKVPVKDQNITKQVKAKIDSCKIYIQP